MAPLTTGRPASLEAVASETASLPWSHREPAGGRSAGGVWHRASSRKRIAVTPPCEEHAKDEPVEQPKPSGHLHRADQQEGEHRPQLGCLVRIPAAVPCAAELYITARRIGSPPGDRRLTADVAKH
jgi:hypothetical protein